MGAIALGIRGIARKHVESLSDSELVERTRRGDTEAFSELVRRHENSVYNLALRYTRDPTRAEDLAQEAFIKGFRLLKGFRGDCRFSTWMYRVTSSVCLTELKRTGRRQETALEAWHERGEATDEPENRDRAELIRRCVNTLPPRYAAIMTMYYLEELPYDEIANAMEIPVGTLKTWMFRARKELRAIVESELGDANGLAI